VKVSAFVIHTSGKSIGIDQNVGENRTLSDTETELFEAVEMDKDPTTGGNELSAKKGTQGSTA
jgi:hypothetical protein